MFGDIGKDAFSNADYTIRAWFITAIVSGGVAVGRAYFGYTMADYRLRVEGIEGKEDAATPDKVRKISDSSWIFFLLGVGLASLASAMLLVAAWTPPKGP